MKQNAKVTPILVPEKGKNSKKQKLTDIIPQKTKLKASDSNPEYGSDKQQITCQYFSKWSKSSMHNHTTENCRNWNSDSTSKYSRTSKNANKHSKESVEMMAFTQMQKENKKFMKKLSSKKQSKISNRKQCYSSSDSSNGSDFD